MLAGTSEIKAEALISYERRLRQRTVKKLTQGPLLKTGRNLNPCHLNNRFRERLFTIRPDNAGNAPWGLKDQNNDLFHNFKLKLKNFSYVFT